MPGWGSDSGWSSEGEDRFATDRWESYSDLMAVMLLVFALILSAIMLVAAEEGAESARRGEELGDLRGAAEARMGVRKAIIDELSAALAKYNVEVDSFTGAIRIGAEVLFAEAEWQVTEEGQRTLKEVMDAYTAVFFGTRFENDLSRIVVEGHTNDNGGYLYNLELSQKRAYAVMKHILRSAEDGHAAHLLQRYVVASGRSYMDLRHDSNGAVDKAGSRRIEVKFALKDEQTIRELQMMLAESQR